jgi:hypothetical protein
MVAGLAPGETLDYRPLAATLTSESAAPGRRVSQRQRDTRSR